MEQRRIFSASDLAQFEYCPLAWWYEEFIDFAQSDQTGLTERLEELEDEYLAAADEQPEYQMLKRLLERANRFALGRDSQTADAAERGLDQSDAATITAPVPRAFAAVVVGLVTLTVLLMGLGLLLWLR